MHLNWHLYHLSRNRKDTTHRSKNAAADFWENRPTESLLLSSYRSAMPRLQASDILSLLIFFSSRYHRGKLCCNNNKKRGFKISMIKSYCSWRIQLKETGDALMSWLPRNTKTQWIPWISQYLYNIWPTMDWHKPRYSTLSTTAV